MKLRSKGTRKPSSKEPPPSSVAATLPSSDNPPTPPAVKEPPPRLVAAERPTSDNQPTPSAALPSSDNPPTPSDDLPTPSAALPSSDNPPTPSALKEPPMPSALKETPLSLGTTVLPASNNPPTPSHGLLTQSTNDQPTPFANDPVRGPSLTVPQEDIEALNGPNFLTTALLDYLIQKAAPRDLSDNVLIGSSNSMSFFQTMNQKQTHPTNSADVATANILRRKYQFYSMRDYRFLSVNCSQGHFFVVSVVFDMNATKPFKEVLVYDSIRKSGRNSNAVAPHSQPGKYLRLLQLFLDQFCAFATKNHTSLLAIPDMILEKAKYGTSPQQHNTHDCGLFALATLLHLLDGNAGSKMKDVFTQEHIGRLRHAIYQEFHTGAKQLSWNFYCTYLPALATRVEPTATATATNLGLSSDDEALPYKESDDSDRYDTSYSDDIPEANTPPPLMTIDKDMSNVEDRNATEVLDTTFTEMFIDRSKQYKSLEELNTDMDHYEEVTGYRTIIKRSEDFARTYVCGTHLGCCFRAKFGKMRGEEAIVLKTFWTKAYHSGVRAPPTAKGRAYKKRLKGRVDPSVDEVATIKDGKPKPKDVMKAAAHLSNLETTYFQAYRAIQRRTEENWEQDKYSFQMVIPYLVKFQDQNEHTTIQFEKDGDHLKRIFICPGIMKSRMRFVRPVMSLDAAHLKSQWGGTLYIASVKTACDEIYPVAVAIMRENENYDGWNWFLQNLHTAVEILVMDHPKGRVRYKYFSFVSDRQKGLLQALKNVFPSNHSWFCSIHIARNTQQIAGKKVASFVHPLSTSFSHPQTTRWLEKIEKMSHAGRSYLDGIEPNQWKGTAWLDDLGLPPRYGIVTSNMSESANSMFGKAREGSWLHSIDTILGTMTERIAMLRKRVADKEGIVPTVLKKLRESWEACAGYKVIEVHNQGDEFNVVRQSTSASEEPRRYNIDIGLCTCSCGRWQEFGYPCVDVMAYYRLEKKLSFIRILEELVDSQYKYETERELLELNVVPVCIETIAPDGITLPPIPCKKRSSGRPKKQRFRKRSRWALEPEKSNIKCSACGMPGHNNRTCEARKRMEEEDRKRSPEERMNELDLS